MQSAQEVRLHSCQLTTAQLVEQVKLLSINAPLETHDVYAAIEDRVDTGIKALIETQRTAVYTLKGEMEQEREQTGNIFWKKLERTVNLTEAVLEYIQSTSSAK